MAYRVDYEESKVKSKHRDKAVLPVPLMSLLFFLVFLIMINFFWPEGADLVRNALIPGDPEKTMQALEVLSQELHCGVPISTAVEGFCRDVMSEAGIYAPD